MSTNIKEIFSLKSDLKNRYIKDYVELKKAVDLCKNMGYRVVLTQGVYDLIHEGHAIYLEKARSLGDILIVGVDSDVLTRARKGPDRPVVPQDERIRMLVHLRHVDIVTLRDLGDDIGLLIKTVQPDVLVVSQSTNDFTKEQKLAYKNYCKKIVILPAQAKATTSARIRNLALEGAEKLAQEVAKLTQDFLIKIRQTK